jgi:hypothetical protein
VIILSNAVGNIRVLPQPANKNKLEELRNRLARAHTLVNRLKAEAQLEYGDRKNSLGYVNGYLIDLENFIEDLTRFVDGLSDQEADLGIVGKFSLPEARRRLNLFTGIVQRLEAKEAIKQLPKGA